MALLRDKIENALNESRMLILGVQVLIGFQFQAPFQSGFAGLSPEMQNLRLIALSLTLVTLALLLMPTAYHRIVVQGQDTPDLHGFTGVVTSIALFPFALALALEFFIALETIFPFSPALTGGLVILAISLLFWYGLEVLILMKRDNQHETRSSNSPSRARSSQSEDAAATSLSDEVKQVLTEARMVLPGAQALLGFQFATMLLEGFARLPEYLKYIHLACLALIAICTILLIAPPAAYHRLVEQGEETESFVRFASTMVLSAMVFLALGIAGDFLVVVTVVTNSFNVGLVSALLSLVLSLGLWFGFTTYLRVTRKHLIPQEDSR